MFINKNGQREHKSHLFFDENKSDARCLRFETNIKKNWVLKWNEIMNNSRWAKFQQLSIDKHEEPRRGRLTVGQYYWKMWDKYFGMR